jgi:hypothetical protein
MKIERLKKGRESDGISKGKLKQVNFSAKGLLF